MNGNFFFNSVPERLYRLAFYCSPCLHFNFTEVVGDKLFHSDYQPRHSAAGQPAYKLYFNMETVIFKSHYINLSQ